MRLASEDVQIERAAATVTFADALRRLDFPTTKREAIRRVGDVAVPMTDRLHAPLADLLSGLPEKSLVDFPTATKALDQRWVRVARTLAQVEAAERARN